MSQEASPDSQWEFVEETIPDNTQFTGGTEFHKRWRLRNTGPATWDSTYRIVFVTGEIFSGPEEIGLAHDVQPDQEIDIVFFLTAPETPGTYRGDWHIVDGEGRIVQSTTGGGNFWLIVEATEADAVIEAEAEAETDDGSAGTMADAETKPEAGDAGVRAEAVPEKPAKRVLRPETLPDWVMGVNMRDFAYFDIRGIHNAKNIAAYQQHHAQLLRDLGVKAVRFYGCHMHFDADECIDRIGQALRVLEEHGMQAVISLNDALGHSQMFVKGDEKYHTEPPEGYLHKSYFNKGLYHENYLPHVEKVTKAFANRDSVLIWELGNEYVTIPVGATDEDLDGFYTFAQVASDTVAAVTTQRISLGLLNSRQISQRDQASVFNYAKRLYTLPHIDLVTAHYYRQDGERSWAVVESQVARQLNMPFYIGEMGSSHDFGDRVPFYHNEISFWRKNGAFMVMPWGYSVENQPYLDNRSIIGQHHHDFHAVVGVLSNLA